MKFIDLHCDTAGKIFYENLNLRNEICKVNIRKLKEGESLGQVFAFFVDQKVNDDTYNEFLKLYTRFQKEINENINDIEIVRNIGELRNAEKVGKIGAFLSIEEGEVINGSIEKLKHVYEL
jgi:membrane dipeptidase